MNADKTYNNIRTTPTLALPLRGREDNLQSGPKKSLLPPQGEGWDGGGCAES